MSVINIDHIRAVLARWLPDQDITITRAGSGISTPVFRAQVGNEYVWVRAGEQPGERRDGEVAAHRRLAAAGVPVPAIVRYEAAPVGLDRSLALTTHMPGIPLANLPPDRWTESIAMDVGSILARINAMPVRGFGWAYATSERGISVAEHASRSAWTREYRDAAHTIHERGVLDASMAISLENTVERWANLPDGGCGSLAHGDFDASHIYVDTDRLTVIGVVDLGEVRGADPYYDLGHLLLHDGESGRPELFPHILDGYAGITPLPDDTMSQIRMQALAIGTRALAIQLTRTLSPYRDWLIARIERLVTHTG